MNIIFTTKKISVGGVAVVSIILANRMAEEGHNVSIFGFTDKYDKVSYERISPKVHVYYGKGIGYSLANVRCLREMFEIEKPDYVINQWGFHWFNITCIRQALKDKHTKVITFAHNDVSNNGRLQACDLALSKCNNSVGRLFIKTKRLAARIFTAISMRYVYHQSDRYMVLSKCYIEAFKHYTWLQNTPKLGVLTNPITIDTDGYKYNIDEKRKEVIYCGRIDFNQKRNKRQIDCWKLLESKNQDWQFTIVGDGDDMASFKQYIDDKNVHNVSLEGFQSPIKYYKRASILILTSEYEGFPLVLAECMRYGVVPIVLGSYNAVYDIIIDGVDGFILPYDNSLGFDVESFAYKMDYLMNNPEVLKKMELAAIETSKKYSLDTIYEQWMKLFKNINII